MYIDVGEPRLFFKRYSSSNFIVSQTAGKRDSACWLAAHRILFSSRAVGGQN
jgi:hypothetical protein